MARVLAKSRRPVLICGTDLVPQGLPARAAGLVRLLRDEGKGAGLFFVLPGANSLGAVLTAPEEAEEDDLLEALEQGEVKALLAVESDPLFNCPDRARLERALDRLNLLVVLDHLPSPLVERAHIFLPTTNLFEATGGSLINQEGRLQRAQPVEEPGTPIAQIGGGAHPPRVYSLEAPGGDPRPADQLLDEMARGLSAVSERLPRPNAWEWLAERQPALGKDLHHGLPRYGRRVLPLRVHGGEVKEDPLAALPSEDQLELMVSPAVMTGEEMAAYSPVLEQYASASTLWLHAWTPPTSWA